MLASLLVLESVLELERRLPSQLSRATDTDRGLRPRPAPCAGAPPPGLSGGGGGAGGRRPSAVRAATSMTLATPRRDTRAEVSTYITAPAHTALYICSLPAGAPPTYLLGHGQRLAGGDGCPAPRPAVALAAHQHDGRGGGLEPQVGHPLVDGGEERAGVRDAVAQQEHVCLPVGEAAHGAGLGRARGVPDDEPHHPRPHHLAALVPEERGRAVVLQHRNIGGRDNVRQNALRSQTLFGL